MASSFPIRRLEAADAESYRDLRLLGLRDCPEAFGASYEEEASSPLVWFAERLERNIVFGAWRDVSLLGIPGLHVPPTDKSSHKASLWGVFVSPRARRLGLATALIAQQLETVPVGVEEIRAAVVATNAEAVRIYARAGFKPYGLDRRALKINGVYFDELLLRLELGRGEAGGGQKDRRPLALRRLSLSPI